MAGSPIRFGYGVAWALAVALLLAACQNRGRRPIEVQPIAPVSPGDESGGGDDFNQWEPGDRDQDLGAKAELRASFTEEQLAPYVDLNARLEYDFTYLTHQKSGSIQFAAGKADLVFGDLTVGQSGTLRLEIKENGSVVLRGEIPNLTLKAGRNAVDLTLKEVGGGDDNGAGDDDKAELVIKLTIEGAGQAGDDAAPDEDGDDNDDNNNNGGGGQGADFEAVRTLAQQACTGCHHTDPLTREWWEGKTEKPKVALVRSLDGTGGLPMPPPGTRQAAALDSAAKRKLLDFVSK